MSKKRLLTSILALVLTAIAAISTSVAPVAAQQRQIPSDCFNGQGSLNSNFRTNMNFMVGGRAFLLTYQEYDSGKTVTAYGLFLRRSDKADKNKSYIYWYTPIAKDCAYRDAIRSAVEQANPGYTVVIE